MKNKTKDKSGFVALAKKSLAVIAAAFGVLSYGNAGAKVPFAEPEFNPDKLTYESYQKRILKSKLVLKLNPSNPGLSVLALHKSHSSHRSHSSHSSHYSSSSSYGSGSSDYTSPSGNSRSSGSSSQNSGAKKPVGKETLEEYTLGSRSLYKGLKGTDVEALQTLLLGIGYDVSITGYFGDKTDAAVRAFQKENSLELNGRVDKKTLDLILAQ